MLLKTDGFQQMVTSVAARAGQCELVSDAVQVAVTLDGRVGYRQGLRALTPAERVVVRDAECRGARLDRDGRCGELLALADSGRLRVIGAGERIPTDVHLLGAVDWGGEAPAGVLAESRAAAARQRARFHEMQRWLAKHPAEEVRRWVAEMETALTHMAPVLIYVGARRYSNLGRFSNLPGKSLAVGAEESLTTALGTLPVTRWSVEDACFVACVRLLMLSGPPVRAEEFNGVQLGPDELWELLDDRLTEYAAAGSAADSYEVSSGGDFGDRLERLAHACAAARQELLRTGAFVYRVINGLTLHKEERVGTPALGYGDVPASVRDFLRTHSGDRLPADAEFADLPAGLARLAERISTEPAPAGFGSAHEWFLHELLLTVTTALSADVGMGRGPRTLAQLRPAGADHDPLRLATTDFYCCVTPGPEFVARFGEDRAGLVRSISAYSARMRFNSWHYLPHVLGLTQGGPGRDDWFFAPTMPDVTQWSDQHHTGHVAFGVRYAIRVPISVTIGGAWCPGLYDLRLMRVAEPPFDLADLRAATATGRVLAMLHEAMAPYDPPVHDFDNDWYGTHYGARRASRRERPARPRVAADRSA